MRRYPLLDRAGRQMRSEVFSLPAPIGGWNTRDALASMPGTDAVILENFFPNASDVALRKGATNWKTGFATRVKTLMSYAGSTTKKLFAATDSGIFDATSSGAIGAAEVAVTNGYLQYVNFKTAAGSFLHVVNGTDSLLLYDGTTWTSITGVSSPAITGIATTSLIHINVFKRRIWFVQKDSMSMWYLPVDSISGAATEFPLGQYFTRGGFLMAMGTWTIDGGSGVDDLAVFISSEGEVAIFAGTDPSSATTFALKGVYYIGSPIGRRCFAKIGGDMLYLSKQGLYPLSAALQTASIDRTSALSSKIDPTFVESANTFGGNVGWQTVLFPKGNFILVNIPTYPGTQTDQYVMNTITGSWCRFTGWNTTCFEVHNDKLYFGGETSVAEAWTGVDDFGASIVAKAQTAYSYFGGRSGLKHFKLLRPNLKIDNQFNLNLGVNVDFEEIITTSTSVVGTTAQDTWGSGRWDTARWAAESEPFKQWFSVTVPDGYAASLYMEVSTTKATIKWNSTDFLYQSGGVI